MRAILTYHSIDDSGSPISITESAFRRHMHFLAGHGPRVVPLGAILQETGDAVALTFDDGCRNFAEVAAPLLRELGFSATVFVVTDHVGRSNDWSGPRRSGSGIPELQLMDWDTLRRLAAQGIDIGAHTRRHPRLTALAPERRADEIEGAAIRIEQELGTRPVAFAYPYGDVDHAVAAAARQSYSLACTTELRPLHSAEDPLLLPRLDAYYLREAGTLERWGSAAFQRRLWLRAQARRVRRFVTSARERA